MIIKNDPEFDPSIYVEKAYQINSEWKGIQYALPFNMEGRLMFYRKDIFEKEGFKVPTNLEEWLNIVQSLIITQNTRKRNLGSRLHVCN